MNIIVPETGLMGLLEAPDSSQWSTVREAVEQAGVVLRQGGLNAASHAQIGQHLVKHANNYKWEVRKALAHAALYLRHETFDQIVAVLSKDDHALVRNAVRRTLSRRAELSKSDTLKEQHGDLMLQWLEELEVKHGVQARNAARRVSEKLNAQFVKELDHELIKAIFPLSLVLDNLENITLGKRINRAEVTRKVQKARDRVRFLCSVMDSLRALTQEVDLEFQTESLLSLLEEAVHLVRDRKEENTSLVAEFRIDPAITVEVNRHLMLQALTNIIQNSVDAYTNTDRTPKIAVSASAYNGTRVRMAIMDYGCGMSEEGVNDAFLLFATSKPRGTGFGLTIAKKIIESDHNGTVYLESAKGVGTTVKVVLQREQEVLKW
ncbi:MAG: HAMP domain-containing histidine kinase [Magnetococcales bacterium]|nr:HAMP domain-containing histidine kinase [Magnetococcales bacterium]